MILIAFVIHANQLRRELLSVTAQLDSWVLLTIASDPECISGYGKAEASAR
jgi:hypothetical protein